MPERRRSRAAGRATDPVTAATIATALVATTGEMSESLRRSSYSPIIREMLDFSCAIFTPEGEITAQAETIPALLGAMSFAVRAIVDDHPRDTIQPGDIFIVNDPYRGGTHTPDIHIFGPIFAADRLIGWSGTLAHHADIGGTNPGTEGYANRSIFEEGLRFPPIKLFEAGRPVAPLMRYIEGNVREPRATLGDLRAQVAAVKLGTTRVLGLVERYGLKAFEAASAGVLDRGERRLRAAIASRPDGRATAIGHLDDDGLGGGPIAIVATVEVRGDTVSVDFEGTDPQMGGGLNASRSAVMAAVLFAVKAVFDPDAPANGGNARPIRVNLPPGTVVNPAYPAAVSLRHLTAQRITDTVVRAFADLYPETGVAGAFVGFSSLTAEGRHPRTGLATVPQDDCGGGMGGTSDGDGLDAVDTYLGNVGLLPIEICELQYPIRILRTELLPDSGGPGRFRGGLGMVREYEFLDDCDLVAYTEQTRAEFAAWGAHGGLAATAASILLHRADGREERITKTRTRVGAGDRIVISTGGGGGFGTPHDRDPALVRRDVREGKVSAASAAAVYGVEAEASGS
ncbi:MAG TPA: hydantoinase B/oxoprolinase family protein [Vitreimonas sp.]|nr:hydantoinase B/oxoprolinase family protein [Vitreimonas sp.]